MTTQTNNAMGVEDIDLMTIVQLTLPVIENNMIVGNYTKFMEEEY